MPGSLFELQCQCGQVHKISTGASLCWDHGKEWTYQQLICPKCLLIKSRQSDHCCRGDDDRCEVCRSDLQPWAGRVWHERTAEGHVGAEHVQGPCPKCGETVTERDSLMFGLWD